MYSEGMEAWGEPSRYAVLQRREDFHDWFLGENAEGLFLTWAAQDKYFQLQNALQRAAQAGDADQSERCRRMNRRRFAGWQAIYGTSQLVRDLGTAESPQLRWTLLGPAPRHPVPRYRRPQPPRSAERSQ